MGMNDEQRPSRGKVADNLVFLDAVRAARRRDEREAAEQQVEDEEPKGEEE